MVILLELVHRVMTNPSHNSCHDVADLQVAVKSHRQEELLPSMRTHQLRTLLWIVAILLVLTITGGIVRNYLISKNTSRLSPPHAMTEPTAPQQMSTNNHADELSRAATTTTVADLINLAPLPISMKDGREQQFPTAPEPIDPNIIPPVPANHTNALPSPTRTEIQPQRSIKKSSAHKKSAKEPANDAKQLSDEALIDKDRMGAPIFLFGHHYWKEEPTVSTKPK